MIKKIISFVVLFLLLLNIPTIILETSSISLSSPISYLLFSLLGFLIFTNQVKYPKTLIMLAIIASLYFFISALQYNGDYLILIISYIKFMLYLFGLYIAIRYVDQNIIIVFLFFGAVTILLDSLFFRFNDFQGINYVSEYGRYSGFYLNPNTASLICLVGYALTIIKLNRWKSLAFFFTLFGFLTLSRTFILTWIILSLIYLIYNRKELIKSFIIVGLAILLLINFSEKLKLETSRFDLLVGLFSGQIDTGVISKNSRQDQWSVFYNSIYESPIIGNGFRAFSSSSTENDGQGVHNTFLLILGESGFFPFLLLIILFFFLFKKCYNLRKKNLTLILLMFILFIQFLVSHNFFDNGLILFIFLNIIFLLNFNNNKKLI